MSALVLTLYNVNSLRNCSSLSMEWVQFSLGIDFPHWPSILFCRHWEIAQVLGSLRRWIWRCEPCLWGFLDLIPWPVSQSLRFKCLCKLSFWFFCLRGYAGIMAEVSQAFLVRLCPHPQLVMGVFPFTANLNLGWQNFFPEDGHLFLQLIFLSLFWAVFSCT